MYIFSSREINFCSQNNFSFSGPHLSGKFLTNPLSPSSRIPRHGPDFNFVCTPFCDAICSRVIWGDAQVLYSKYVCETLKKVIFKLSSPIAQYFGRYAKPQDKVVIKVICCCLGSLIFGWKRLCITGEMVC